MTGSVLAFPLSDEARQRVLDAYERTSFTGLQRRALESARANTRFYLTSGDAQRIIDADPMRRIRARAIEIADEYAIEARRMADLWRSMTTERS